MKTATELSRGQFLWDVFVTALEGGINYWATVLVYHQRQHNGLDDLDNFRAVVLDAEDPERGRLTVNRAVIEKGLECFKLPEFKIADRIRRGVLMGNVMNDAGEIDAEAADCIVQAGLFGEVIYG